MFSRVISAARGLLAVEPNASQQDQTSSVPASGHAETDADADADGEQGPETTRTMVTATRRSRFQGQEAEAGSMTSTPRTGSPAVNGKRKSASSMPDGADTQTNKRRKKPTVNGDVGRGEDGSSVAEPESLDAGRFRTLESVEIVSRTSSEQHAPKDQDIVQSPPSSIRGGVPANTTDSKSTTGATHVRFGSEDPEPTEEKEEDNRKDTTGAAPSGQDEAVSESGSDDDEAPEAVSNVTRLNELREAERKRADAARKRNQTNKAKRKEHESLLKSQAASKPRHVSPPSVTVSDRHISGHEELRSESSATLQGSDARATEWPVKQPLPTFLPDEILNAEPTARPPTPPRDTEKSTMKASSNKLRFLDAEQKPPKDVVVSGTSVRVLNGLAHYNSKSGSNQSLPPKLSKSSRNVRDSWASGNRNKDVSSGLRRTTGGSSGFVRR